MVYTLKEVAVEEKVVSPDENKVIIKTYTRPIEESFTIAQKKQEIVRIDEEIARQEVRKTGILAEIAEAVEDLGLTIK